MLQNLLALFLRPLKLVVTPGHLRRARIVLLKITHSPYVTAIWVFESISDHLANAKEGSRMISSTRLKGPSRSRTALGTIRGQTPLDASRLTTTQSSSDLAREAASDSSAEDVETSAETTDEHDLKSLVLKLMFKVDLLTDQLAAQK